MKIDDHTVTALLKQELKDVLLSPMGEQHPKPKWLRYVAVQCQSCSWSLESLLLQNSALWDQGQTLPWGMRNRLRPVGSGRSSCHSKDHGRTGQGCPSGDMGAEVGNLPRRAGHQDGHTIPAAPAKGMVPPQEDDHPATSEDSPVRLWETPWERNCTERAWWGQPGQIFSEKWKAPKILSFIKPCLRGCDDYLGVPHRPWAPVRYVLLKVLYGGVTKSWQVVVIKWNGEKLHFTGDLGKSPSSVTQGSQKIPLSHLKSTGLVIWKQQRRNHFRWGWGLGREEMAAFS